MITIDAIKGELSVALSDEELAARKADWIAGPRDTIYASGALVEIRPAVGETYCGGRGHASRRRDGRPQSVAVIDSVIRDGALIVHLRDRSPPPAPGLSPTYRRAFLDVGDALVSIAVLGVDADPMGNAQSRALLAAGIAAIRAANAAPVLAEAG
jgi:hypothetical protein